MNYVQKSDLQQPQDSGSREMDLLSVMIVMAKYKKRIIALPFAVAVLTAAISMILPNVYKAQTALLPPQQSQSTAAALLSQLGGMAGVAAGAAGIKNPNDLYIGMLESRTVADRLISRFDLKKVYETDSNEKARKALDDNTVITNGKDGLITIEVHDKNQKLVAPLANAYVDELVRLTGAFSITEASQRRKFYEQQLEQTKNNLASAEMKLKRGLDTQGVASVDVDSQAILETIGRLRAQISLKEIELNSMKSFVTAQNPDFQRTNEELKSLRGELANLENGRTSSDSEKGEQKSQAGLENIKVLRDVKYYQMLYQLLAKQYEIARLDEAKDVSLIQVMDPAVEPERKFKPQRTLMVLLSAAAAFVAAVLSAFLSDVKRKTLDEPDGAARWAEFNSLLSFKRKAKN